MAKDIQTTILESIETIATKINNDNPRDLTVSAVVVQCLDAEKFKFSIRYGINTFEAYGTTMYNAGDIVLVHIPENDWSKTLTILGLNHEEDSNNSSESQDLNLNVDNDTFGYHILGDSLVDMHNEIKYLSENEYRIIYRINEYESESMSTIESGGDGNLTFEVSSEQEFVSYENNAWEELDITDSDTIENLEKIEEQEQAEKEQTDSIVDEEIPEEDEEDEDIPLVEDILEIPDPTDETGEAEQPIQEVEVTVNPNESNAINSDYLVENEKNLLTTATSLYLQGDFKISEDSVDGSFGIIFIFDFKRENEIYQIPYYLDSSNFEANPLAFTSLTTQGIAVDFNGKDFYRLNKILIYSQGFAHPNIEIGNIKIYPMKKAQTKSNYMMNISAKSGSFVTNSKAAKYFAKAYYKDIDITSSVSFYWGIESDVQKIGQYHILLGKGYNYLGTGNSKEFYVSDVSSHKANVVCVGVYKNKIIAKETINIYNLNFGDSISLKSYLNSDGDTIISCLVNGVSTINSASAEIEESDDDDARQNAAEEKDELNLSINFENFSFDTSVAMDGEEVAEEDYDYTTFLFFQGGFVKDLENEDSDSFIRNYNKYTFRPICARSTYLQRKDGTKDVSIANEYINQSERIWPPYAFSYNTDYETKKNSSVSPKTTAMRTIMQAIGDMVDTKIHKALSTNGLVTFSDSKYGSVSVNSNKLNNPDVSVNDAAATMRGYFMPLKIQVLNDQVVSVYQNELGDLNPPLDGDDSDDGNSSSTDSDKMLTEDSQGTFSEGKLEGVVFTENSTNKKYFRQTLPAPINGQPYLGRDISDGTAPLDEDNQAVITRPLPKVDINGHGYLIIEDDNAKESQLYFPDQNEQVNLSFDPYDEGEGEEDEDSLSTNYSVTFYYNVALDEDNPINSNGFPNVKPPDENGKYTAADPERGEAYVKTFTFDSSCDIEFDYNSVDTISSESVNGYTYQWYRGNDVTNMHHFMDSTVGTGVKNLTSLLSGGIEKYEDNSIVITEIGEKEIIGCKVYNAENRYLGSAYLQL